MLQDIRQDTRHDTRPVPSVAATPMTACPAMAEVTAENRHGELVTRRIRLVPGLPGFAHFLADLRFCGYRGVVLRRLEP